MSAHTWTPNDLNVGVRILATLELLTSTLLHLLLHIRSSPRPQHTLSNRNTTIKLVGWLQAGRALLLRSGNLEWESKLAAVGLAVGIWSSGHSHGSISRDISDTVSGGRKEAADWQQIGSLSPVAAGCQRLSPSCRAAAEGGEFMSAGCIILFALWSHFRCIECFHLNHTAPHMLVMRHSHHHSAPAHYQNKTKRWGLPQWMNCKYVSVCVIRFVSHVL